MIKVLIPTKPDDTHSIYVQQALDKKGHKGLLWYTADYPEQQKHTFELWQNNLYWYSRGTEFTVNNNHEFDVVWVRRPRRPILPKSIHPDDKENAINENAAFFKTFWQVIAPTAFWINPISSLQGVNCKLQQLKLAAELGLKTPETLISNDPVKIKNFIINYNEGDVIYKTLYPVFWMNENELRLTYTKEIRLENLPSNTVLQNTPGIFQKKIPKAFELRVTYLGNYAITVKLRSQEHPKGVMDWRYIPTHELIVEEFYLPEDIHNKCIALMHKFGIVFGCFDFIVTPDNDYYFLEVNEQGQFLWIEEVNPEIKMLDAFTEFLINGSREFLWQKNNRSVSLLDFKNDMIEAQTKAMEIHKDPGMFF